jgi:hypothetical protein
MVLGTPSIGATQALNSRLRLARNAIEQSDNKGVD